MKQNTIKAEILSVLREFHNDRALHVTEIADLMHRKVPVASVQSVCSALRRDGRIFWVRKGYYTTDISRARTPRSRQVKTPLKPQTAFVPQVHLSAAMKQIQDIAVKVSPSLIREKCNLTEEAACDVMGQILFARHRIKDNDDFAKGLACGLSAGFILGRLGDA